MNESEIIYRVNPAITNDELNSLFADSWQNHQPTDFRPVLERSLAFYFYVPTLKDAEN
jgi:hypothetical protein